MTHTLRKVAKLLRKTPLHPQWLLPPHRVVADWVGKNVKGQVLDIGCADRWIEAHLPAECRYVGLDYPSTGKELYRARPDVFADAGCLPFPSESFDTAVMLEVMEHLRDPCRALTEIARVLKPGGRALISMPFLYPLHDAPHDYQRLTTFGLRRDIEAAGLRILEVSPSLASAETAGLVACLALGGMAERALTLRSPAIVLVPVIALSIPVINLFAWLAGRVLPTWDAVASGHRLLVDRP